MKRFVVIALILATCLAARAQNFSDEQRHQAREMLKYIADDIRKHYYDPKFHGVDFDARVNQADEKLKTATSLGQAFAIIGWTLDGLNDSHTYFEPPSRTIRVDYGWKMQMFGDRCFVTHVRPKSDAEAKGLKPGDEVLQLNGVTPTRDNYQTMVYIFNVLAPRGTMHVVVKSPDAEPRQVDANANVRQLQKRVDLSTSSGDNAVWDIVRKLENEDHLTRTRCEDGGGDLGICKIPEFTFSDEDGDRIIGFARKHKAMILDLRGNPGGYVVRFKQLVSGFFDHEVKLFDKVGRKETKPETVKPHDPYTGKLIVLVDSRSSSAAELFARVVQLEKRGTVIGDRSSGLVMEALYYEHQLGMASVSWYGAMITDADLVMTDGKSLEGRGVIPDEVVLPTGKDLAGDMDPALAQAIQELGVKMTPQTAGKLFPYEWAKLD